ncbi:MAG: hypothetical protein JOZ81_07420 [Chloroflexi bacterium]|nr:hypothetical protein [Chloroflexota bacterium]
MFEACLSLPQNRREALLLAEQLDALARALREWPAEAWRSVSERPAADGVFARLLARTAPAALKPSHRKRALKSAAAVADVLRVLWPETVADRGAHEQQELVGAVG